MITWVLVIIIITGSGTSTSTARFHSPQSCQAAADEVKRQQGTFMKVTAYCAQDMDINE